MKLLKKKGKKLDISKLHINNNVRQVSGNPKHCANSLNNFFANFGKYLATYITIL